VSRLLFQRIEYKRLPPRVNHFASEAPRHHDFRWVGWPPVAPRVSCPAARAASGRHLHHPPAAVSPAPVSHARRRPGRPSRRERARRWFRRPAPRTPAASRPRPSGALGHGAARRVPPPDRRAAGRHMDSAAPGTARGAPKGTTLIPSWGQGPHRLAVGYDHRWPQEPRHGPQRPGATPPRRPAAGTPPRSGVTLDGVTSPAGTRGPRMRPAPDGPRQVVAHPWRAACSPGMFDGRRLCRGTA
jgi:hypothetical protein